MTIEQKAFEILQNAFPKFDRGHFDIMKQTSHPLWEQALELAENESDNA